MHCDDADGEKGFVERAFAIIRMVVVCSLQLTRLCHERAEIFLRRFGRHVFCSANKWRLVPRLSELP